MSRIIGYAYLAALHCPDCTRAAMSAAKFHWGDDPEAFTDQHGIPSNALDREGNPVHAVFSTDEPGQGGDYCDTCRVDLRT